MYQQDPDQGAVNAAIAAVKDTVDPPGVLSDARPSTEDAGGIAAGGLTLDEPLEPGGGRPCSGSRGIPADEVPDGRQAGRPARAAPGRDHRRRLAGLQAGRRHAGRGRAARSSGCPASPSSFATPDGDAVEHDETEPDGTFAFDDVEDGEYTVAIGADDLRAAVRRRLAGSARS